MRTRIATFASAVALAIAAMPGVALSGGNGIVCHQPDAPEITHKSPGVCVKTQGFNGPGQAAKSFNDNWDILSAEQQTMLQPAINNNAGKITAGGLIDLNCDTPPEVR